MNTVDRQTRIAMLERAIIPPSLPLLIGVGHLKASKAGILLVCDQNRKLLGILTDGDIRRAILDGKDLSRPCIKFVNPAPVVALEGTSLEHARTLMEESITFKINCLPVVDSKGCVVDLIRREDLKKNETRRITALIMAGGFGTRLGSLTKNTPKPMLKVGGQPLLEHILIHLRDHDVTTAYISTHFRADRIKQHIGNGSRFGMEIHYLYEELPLGTAGAISMLPPIQNTLLMMNGDILTEVDLKAMLEFHINGNSDMTVAVRKYSVELPYGVVKCTGNRIKGLIEKPVTNMLVNAGIYLLEPAVRKFVKAGSPLNMNELICDLIKAGRYLSAFPVIEYWLDIGQKADYQAAKQYDKNLVAA